MYNWYISDLIKYLIVKIGYMFIINSEHILFLI